MLALGLKIIRYEAEGLRTCKKPGTKMKTPWRYCATFFGDVDGVVLYHFIKPDTNGFSYCIRDEGLGARVRPRLSLGCCCLLLPAADGRLVTVSQLLCDSMLLYSRNLAQIRRGEIWVVRLYPPGWIRVLAIRVCTPMSACVHSHTWVPTLLLHLHMCDCSSIYVHTYIHTHCN